MRQITTRALLLMLMTILLTFTGCGSSSSSSDFSNTINELKAHGSQRAVAVENYLKYEGS